VGVRVPVGVGEFKASYSAHRNNVGGGDQKARKLAIGYVHNLSKRTAVYTTFARVTNKGGSRLALAGATTAANASSNGFDIGIRHNF
jgi:predicted porin